jgi:hypothetical protein
VSEQFWTELVRDVVGVLLAYIAYKRLSFQTKTNAAAISDVHGLVNGARTEMVAELKGARTEIGIMKEAISSAIGPEKKKIDDRIAQATKEGVT